MKCFFLLSLSQIIHDDTLTKTELEIVKLISEGCSSKKIATAQSVSLRKIEKHRSNIISGIMDKNYLISKGISSSRLSSSNKIDKEPLVPNTSEENRKKNRRVEFKVIQ